MPNSWFRFKQFTVHQDRCAMKVCTDACLFGAWVASFQIEPARILDIGAGTGLLSLMLAQRWPSASIDAVEIDASCADQARENILASPFADRIMVHTSDIRDLEGGPYDLIVSNPPFYSNDLKSPDDARNAAMHGTTLSLRELASTAAALLNAGGSFCSLLPFSRKDEWQRITESQGMIVQKELTVRQSPDKAPFRVATELVKSGNQLDKRELVIRETPGLYSPDFRKLLAPYYLDL